MTKRSPAKTCVQCGVKITRPKAHKYCSDACSTLYMQAHRGQGFKRTTGQGRKCAHCDTYYVPPGRWRRRFCSDTCRDEFWKAARRINKPVQECLYCGAEFDPGHTAKFYCTKKCQWTARQDARYFQGLRRTAIGMGLRECWVCRKPNLKRIHVHHVIRKANYDYPMLVVLCPGCHEIVSKLGRRVFLDNPKVVQDLLTLARFARELPNARTTVTYEVI